MARMIRHEPTGPYRIECGEKPVFICGCGLTRNLPHCDGSHAACRDEEPGKLYIYDAARQEIVEIKAEAP